jgi:hypothetical protein
LDEIAYISHNYISRASNSSTTFTIPPIFQGRDPSALVADISDTMGSVEGIGGADFIGQKREQNELVAETDN